MVNVLIYGGNLLLLIGYNVYCRSNYDQGLDFVIGYAVLIGLHLFVCLLLAAIFDKFRRAFVLSAIVVLLIGFSTCCYGV